MDYKLINKFMTKASELKIHITKLQDRIEDLETELKTHRQTFDAHKEPIITKQTDREEN